jgi:hypothetical protein
MVDLHFFCQEVNHGHRIVLLFFAQPIPPITKFIGVLNLPRHISTILHQCNYIQPEAVQADFAIAIRLSRAKLPLETGVLAGDEGRSPDDYWRDTFNLALYHLAAGNLDPATQLYRSGCTAPRERLEMAQQDLADLRMVVPDFAAVQTMQQMLSDAD